MKTELTGTVNDEMLETAQKALQVFFGKQIRIIIEENDGDKRRKKG